MTSTLKLDIGFRQLGRNESVEVSLYALHLLVLLALLGMDGSSGGDFFRRERHDFGFRAKEHFGVVGKTAQSCQVLALHIRLHSEQLLVVGVAGIEGLLIVCAHGLKIYDSRRRIFIFSHRLHRCTQILLLRGNSPELSSSFVRNFICANLCNLWETFILEDDTQTVATDGGIAHQRMRVSNNLRLKLTKCLGIIRAICVICGRNMVEVYQRESRQSRDVLLALTALEEARHGKERTLALESLAARLAIRQGEGSQLLVIAHEIGDTVK